MGDSMKQEVSAQRWMYKLIEHCCVLNQSEHYHGERLSPDEIGKLVSMGKEEDEWRGALLVSLLEDEVILHPEDLTHEELREFIGMQPRQGTQWRDKVTRRKSLQSKDINTASENAAASQFRAARWDERTVSMELKMLPAVREAAKQIATAHGMTAQEYVQHLLVDSLNKNLHEVEEGKKRLEQFKGSTVAAKRYTQEEELARLRAVQQSKSSSRTPSR